MSVFTRPRHPGPRVMQLFTRSSRLRPQPFGRGSAVSSRGRAGPSETYRPDRQPDTGGGADYLLLNAEQQAPANRLQNKINYNLIQVL